jgi:beta-galactosidase/beta-glucuronidase
MQNSSIVSINVELGNIIQDDEHIQFTLYDAATDNDDDDEAIIYNLMTIAKKRVNIESNTINVELNCTNVTYWSPERPYLYTLIIHTSTQCEMMRLGFRECMVGTVGKNEKQKFFLLNGVPQVIAGVNYHEHDRFTGKTLNSDNYAKDLWMMKNANFNAVSLERLKKEMTKNLFCVNTNFLLPFLFKYIGTYMSLSTRSSIL